MVKKNALLVPLAVLVFILLTACTLPVQTQLEVAEMQAQANFVVPPVATASSVPEQGVSCAAPTPEVRSHCREMEADVLATTVRMVMAVYVPDPEGEGSQYVTGGVSHATIRNGRYLVTHNHFGLSPQDLADGRLSRLSIYKANGEILLKDAPFGAFDVVLADPQTLLFDFGDYGGQGLFAFMGMASAKFRTWEAVGLQPGVEVAQLNWDGETAHVDWVRVTAVHSGDDTPQLELENFVQQGASGGGVFYNGYHIANNWTRVTNETNTGQVLRQFSVAALNSVAGMNLSQQTVSVAAGDAAAASDSYLSEETAEIGRLQ